METGMGHPRQSPVPKRVFLFFLFAFACITAVLVVFAIARVVHANHAARDATASQASAAHHTPLRFAPEMNRASMPGAQLMGGAASAPIYL